jgi:hypothetical protein
VTARERALRYVAAALILVGGLVHLKLYDDGYKDVPNQNLGRSFLLNAAASVIVAVAIVVSRHVLALLAGLVLVNGTLLAFALSRGPGIFGFTETGWNPSPEAAIALVCEIAAAVLLLVLLAPRRAATEPARAPTLS